MAVPRVLSPGCLELKDVTAVVWCSIFHFVCFFLPRFASPGDEFDDVLKAVTCLTVASTWCNVVR